MHGIVRATEWDKKNCIYAYVSTISWRNKGWVGWLTSLWGWHACFFWKVATAVFNYPYVLYTECGPGTSVGIATDYGLDGPGSNPGEDEIFSPSRLALGPPAYCKMGTGSFPGVKCGRGVLLTTHPLLEPRSWKSRAMCEEREKPTRCNN